jgi:hypothetical protein
LQWCLIYNKGARCEWEEQKLKEIIARQFVHLLCQSISHDSCVIQKTTRLLLDYLRIVRVFRPKVQILLHFTTKINTRWWFIYEGR